MAGHQKTSVRSLSQGCHTQTNSAVVPDLTFHEMHFLKRPPPPKPVPRGRERAKRRGERELEEVSAFFLHKGLPEVSGTSGRDQPTVSGALSLDRAKRNSSASIIDAPPHQSRSGEDYGYKSPEMDKESSRGPTSWTWSSSYVPLERGTAHASVAREYAPTQSSTPSRSRNALERTGIFKNTGISCVERPKKVSSATSRSKNNWSNREPLAVVSADTVNRQQDMPRQNVRIVRYHDRGVMASEEAETTAGWGQKATESRQDAIEQPKESTPAKIRASASSVKCSRFASEDTAVSHHQEEGDVCIAATFHATDHDTGLDRPRSPKWTVVEQLEAAAENVASQNIHNHLARGLTSLPVREDVRSASCHHNHPVLGTHDASQHGQPGFVGDRQLDLFEAIQENNRLDTIADELRDSQRAHEFNLTPQIALRPTSGNSHLIGEVKQPEFNVKIASSAHRGPSGAHSMARYTLGSLSSAQTIFPNSDTGSHDVMDDWAAIGHGQLASNHFFPRAHSVLPEAAELSPQRSNRQQSLEDYIAQIENEVLCRPQEEDVDGDSPMPSWHGMQDNDAVYPDCAPQAHQSHFGAYDREPSEDSHLKNLSIGGTHDGSGGGMHNSHVDQEEQRFISTFWRPNCY